MYYHTFINKIIRSLNKNNAKYFQEKNTTFRMHRLYLQPLFILYTAL